MTIRPFHHGCHGQACRLGYIRIPLFYWLSQLSHLFRFPRFGVRLPLFFALGATNCCTELEMLHRRARGPPGRFPSWKRPLHAPRYGSANASMLRYRTINIDSTAPRLLSRFPEYRNTHLRGNSDGNHHEAREERRLAELYCYHQKEEKG